jgi:hypothetical protein
MNHESIKHQLKHFLYAGGWKKFEPLWNLVIKTKSLNDMLPLLEFILAQVKPRELIGKEKEIAYNNLLTINE